MKKGLKRTAALLMSLMLIAGVGTMRALADNSETHTVQITVEFQQQKARDMLALVNAFRISTTDAWYWNSDDQTKTVFNDADGPALSELTYDYALEKVAMQRAAELAVMGPNNLSHTRPDGQDCFTAYDELGYNTGYMGENIALGSGGSPCDNTAGTFTVWAEEDKDYAGQGHRRIMLSGNATTIGIGCVYYDGIYYWAMELGDNVTGAADHGVNGAQTVDVRVLGSGDDNSGSGDDGNTGDNGGSGDDGNTGDNGGSGDDGNTGDNGGSGDDGNTGDNGGSGDDVNTGDDNGSGDSGNAGGSCGSVDTGSDGSEVELVSDLEDMVEVAESGSTVTFTKEMGITALPASVMHDLAARGDVTLVMEYVYDGVNYTITIPAGKAVESDISWYGPLWLAAHYGNGATGATGAGAANGDVYTVKASDTMSKIARANGMTLAQLAAKNPQIKDVNVIVVGQKINVK